MAARIAVKRWVDKKREAEEEIILPDSQEFDVDKPTTKIENTAEEDIGEN